jgi:hypothetical protein
VWPERCGQTGRKGEKIIASNDHNAGLMCPAWRGRIQLPCQEARFPSSFQEEGNALPSSYSQLWCRFAIHQEDMQSEHLRARRGVDSGDLFSSERSALIPMQAIRITDLNSHHPWRGDSPLHAALISICPAQQAQAREEG